MKERTKTLLKGSALGAAATAVAFIIWYALFGPTVTSYEDGIRVKNGGSVILESDDGFEAVAGTGARKKYRSKQKGGCYKVKVLGSSDCPNDPVYEPIARMELLDTAGRTHQLKDSRGEGHFLLESDDTWAATGTQLKYGAADVKVQKLTLHRHGGGARIECTFPANATDVAAVTLVVCR